MNKEQILELANSLEAANGPSREWDAAIAIALTPSTETGNARKVIISHGAKPGDYEWSDISGVSLRTSPAYTTSLDGAMQLVPEGWYLEMKGPRTYLNIPTQVPNYWSVHLSTFNHEGQKAGWGATPALALCAAALRAKAETL